MPAFLTFEITAVELISQVGKAGMPPLFRPFTLC